MNPNDNSEINVALLLALRKENDALRIITEKLEVKEMGPADHIRTKHEVKAFVVSGTSEMAKEILKMAQIRRQNNISVKVGVTQQKGHRTEF